MKYKKILFIFLLSFLFVIFISPCVFGSYDVIGTNNTIYKLPDDVSNFKYFAVFKPNTSGDFTYILCSNDEFVISSNSTLSKLTIGWTTSKKKYTAYSKAGVSGTDFSSGFTIHSGSATFMHDGIYDYFYNLTNYSIVAINFDLKKVDGTIFIDNTNLPDPVLPKITNDIETFETLDFEYVNINANSYSDRTLYLLVYDISKTLNSEDIKDIYPKNEIKLNTTCKYYNSSFSSPENAIYFVDIEDLGVKYKIGGEYAFRIATRERASTGGGFDDIWYYNYLGDIVSFTVSSDVTSKKLEELNKAAEEFQRQKERKEDIAIQEEQTNAIRENTETNKNIFQKIGDILSYINPFSENFFGRKLVELIIDGIKGLFIPKDGFFDNFFTNLKDWFSARFGFLFYPFELIIDILNRILSINLGGPAFTIPNIIEPSTGVTLIQERSYNLNSILENNAFKTVHDIYLVLVDAFIVFGLVNLTKRKLEEVETK